MSRPLSGTDGVMIWACGCETKLGRGEELPAGCPTHDRTRVKINAPWAMELACRIYTDDFGRVFITDKNGDGRVVFDPSQGDNDFSRMFDVIEEGVEFELRKQEEKSS